MALTQGTDRYRQPSWTEYAEMAGPDEDLCETCAHAVEITSICRCWNRKASIELTICVREHDASGEPTGELMDEPCHECDGYELMDG